tara:strand:+ start:366 stop:515 length:150 start_codon:yes stop_codon:yes gene_type:complete
MRKRKYIRKKPVHRDEKDLSWMEILVQRSSDPKWNKPDRPRKYNKDDES